MGLKTEQQILELVKQKDNVLICLPKDPTTDAIASGLALFSVLEKMGKKVKAVAHDFSMPANHNFLPKSKEIFSEIKALRKFIISVDVTKTKAENVEYDIKNDKLNIYVTPKDGYFEDTDVETNSDDFAFDLIFTIDCPDLDALGPLYDINAEFFYHTPIINVDHNPANEYFGQINLISVTATSVSEILFELIQEWDEKYLDEYIATNLLTGIISKTKSFKTSTVTPRSMAIASHLISGGARREDIVRNLYQNKSLETLKLWGKALSKLKSDPDNKIVWAIITPDDFKETQAKESNLDKVIDELIINSPESENVFIIFQNALGKTRAVLSTAHYLDAFKLFYDCNPTGNQDFTYLEFKDNNLLNVEKLILDRLKTNVN